MDVEKVLSIIGGILGFLSPILLFLINWIKKAEKQLIDKDLSRLNEITTEIKEDIESIREYVDINSRENNKEFSKIHDFHKSLPGFYVIREDFKELMDKNEKSFISLRDEINDKIGGMAQANASSKMDLLIAEIMKKNGREKG